MSSTATLSNDEIRDLILDGVIITSEEVARRLGVSRVTVRTMVAKGRLTPIRPGTNPLLFHADEVADRPVMDPARHARLREIWLAS